MAVGADKMPSFPSVPAEIGNEPERLAAASSLAPVRPLPCVEPQVLGPGPFPLEGNCASFPRALEGPLVIVHALVTDHVLVIAEPLPAIRVCAPVVPVEL